MSSTPPDTDRRPRTVARQVTLPRRSTWRRRAAGQTLRLTGGAGPYNLRAWCLRLFVAIAIAGRPVSAQGAIPPPVPRPPLSRRVDTLTVEQRVFMSPDLTPTQARRRALDNALADAVRQVAGVRVQSTVLRLQDEQGATRRDGYSSVVQLDAAARATDYRVLSEEWQTIRHPELGSQLYLRTTTWVTVEREEGVPDAGFIVDVTLNATRFVVRTGPTSNADEVVATVRSTREAFLTLFVIADDSAERLFPNSYLPQVSVTDDGPLDIPTPDWRARGLRLRASLPDGRPERKELLMVVATRGFIAPPSSSSLTVMEVQRWLVRIPMDLRAVAFVGYDVVRDR